MPPLASTTRSRSVAASRYDDLYFKKSGNNLVLMTESEEQITFVNWYAAAANRNIDTLQIMIATTEDYDAGSADALWNKYSADLRLRRARLGVRSGAPGDAGPHGLGVVERARELPPRQAAIRR